MDPNPGIEQRVAETEQAAAAMRSEAARQLESARDLAKRVRAEALHELEDARARIAAREEEMAERWAQLLEAENALAVSQGSTRKSDDLTGIPSQLIADATAEAQQIITRSHEEARNIREEAMRLLAVAEGEKAESREIAMTETQRAAMEAERLRAEAAEEAKRLREEASRLAAAGADSAYVKRAGRKLPRIGDSANSLLSEMSGLRAKMNEDQDSKVG
jgi:hypothetical protein